MEPDIYDEDLPEPYLTLVESWQTNRESILTLTKIIGLPVVAFVATCVFNYYVDKKIGSL